MKLIHQKILLKSAEQVTLFCRVANDKTEAGEVPSMLMSSAQPLTDAQKLRKIILELVNTERSYVRDLSMLMERYLEPLKEETFLSSDEVTRLVGNIQEIVNFQKKFLRHLEEAIDDENFLILAKVTDFKKIVHAISGSFLYYSSYFKLYSSFCASHSRAQKVLSPGDNTELYEFLHARNPKNQHSATLESYLIKPIQRILKYPLLIQQLRVLMEPSSDEYKHLSDALQEMELVASHINEMQKIYEEFGAIFDELAQVHPTKDAPVSPSEKRKLELNVGDLHYYNESEWLNSDLNKPRKGYEQVTTIFVFLHGVVFLCQEKPKGKPQKVKHMSTTKAVDNTVYTRFLPISEIQVRSIPTAHPQRTVALWELLHLKSDHRPEKIYHMACSNVEIRTEFLKQIRQLIRDSVQKLAVPKSKPFPSDIAKNRHSVNAEGYVLPVPKHNPSHAKTNKLDNRFSMHMDMDKLNLPDLETGRSRTYGDLAELADHVMTHGNSLSRNSVNSDISQGGSARLVYSSQDPLTYSSKSSLECSDGNSPIWQMRRDNSHNCNESMYDKSMDAHVKQLNVRSIFSAVTDC